MIKGHKRLLDDGFSFSSVTGTNYKVEGFISSGTQGQIYRVRSGDGNIFALKAYYPAFAAIPHLQADIKHLTTAKKSPSSAFVWPREIAVVKNTWGYIMNYVLPERANKIFDGDCLMDRAAACAVAKNIAQAMSALHSTGLCYKDLSPNNFEFNKETFEVYIFDCDNIRTKGDKCTVSGTCGYRAPEIVLNNNYPDEFSDYYAMATIFFKMWLGWDVSPLEGKNMAKFDGILENGLNAGISDAEKYIYGTNPLFIFDPNDRTNELEEGFEGEIKRELWNNFTPQRLKDLWQKTYTVGLTDPKARPIDTDWVKAFTIVQLSLKPCPFCSVQNIPSKYCIACGLELRV